MGGKAITEKLKAVLEAFPHPLILWPGIAAFSLTGPFGTYETHSYPVLLAYWASVILGAGLFFNASVLYFLTLDAIAGWNRLSRVALGALFATPPTAALVYAIDGLLRASSSGVLFYLWLCACVFIVGMAISLIEYRKPKQAEFRFAQAGAKNDFISRLPEHLGTDLVSMSMQDHYVEVVTKKGREMIHSRFGDALASVAKHAGVQCHRSHWVALNAIAGSKLTGKDKHVSLVDGRRIPVSDSYVQQVQSAVNSV